MKDFKLIYIVVLITMLPMLSCEDFLERPPLDQISETNYWKTTNDLKNYILQFYPETWPTHSRSAQITPYGYETKSDNMTLQSANTLLNGDMPVNAGTWTGDWSEIRSINIFFDNYRKCEDPFSAYQHILGEAYFFRAWLYFNLVKTYGDVPWYSTALSPDDEEFLNKARDPRTLVVDSILSDLDHAINYLNTRAESEHGNAAINKEAALALKTRVALYEGTWQKYHSGASFATQGADPDKYFQACVDAAEELIKGNYTVGIYNTGNPELDWHTLFSTDDLGPVNEILLYKPYSFTAGLGHNAHKYAAGDLQNYGVTWSLVTSYLGLDGKPYDYLDLASTTKGSSFLTAISEDCDPRLQQTVWAPGQLVFEDNQVLYEKPELVRVSTGFQCKVYARPDLTAQSGCFSGFVILRYAEVLLNYAEAKYELDGTVAYEQLNLLRERAGMPDFTINSQSEDPNLIDYGYKISDELYEIRRERRVETAIQNLREHDWKRWAAHALFKDKRFKGLPFDPAENPGYSVPVDENGLIDVMKPFIPDGHQFRPGQDYLESIPQTELNLNPNLTQNPGWEE